MTSTSIVIGSHNRPENLIRTIESCNKLNFKDFEVIVIDSSIKPIDKIIQETVDTYIHDPKLKSLSSKRNLGIKLSKGQIIVYTDDDCILHKYWLREITKPFVNERIMCVTGRTLPFIGKEKSAFEKRFSFDLGMKNRLIKYSFSMKLWRIGHGNNMAFRKKVFKKIGLFDENLGVGSKGERGEDSDMFFRILKKGYRIFYNPNAVLFHDHLITKEQLPRMSLLNGYGWKVLFKKYFYEPYFIFLYFSGLFILFFRFLKTKGFQNKLAFYNLKGMLGFKR